MSNLINEVLFNAGEGIEATDLNNLQKVINYKMYDMSSVWHSDLFSSVGFPDSSLSSYVLVRDASQCIPVANGSNLTLTNLPGTIYQSTYAGEGPDGYTNKILQYACVADELLSTFTTNSSGNTRYDIVCVKITPNNATDPETRDFQDATTGVITSVSTNKRNSTSLSVQVVQGTPASHPVAPSTPTGYALYAVVCIPNSFNSTLLPQHIADNRLPSRIKTIRTYANDLIAPTSGWAVSGNGAVANTGAGFIPAGYFPFRGGAGARILQINIYGTFTATDMLAKLFTLTYNSGPSTLTEYNTAWATASSGTGRILVAPHSFYQTYIGDPYSYANNSSPQMPTVWGNGSTCGMTAYQLETAAAQGTMLTVQISVTGSTYPNEYVQAVEWIYVE